MKLPDLMNSLTNRIHIIIDSTLIKIKWRRKLSYPLNLRTPTTFNEKIQWLKLYSRKPIHTLCADKLLVRDYVEERIGQESLIPLLWSGTDPNRIPFQNLPDEYIIKTSHTSSRNILVKDSHMLIRGVAHPFEKNLLLKTLTKYLRENYYKRYREWQYKNITPTIVVEHLLKNPDNSEIANYKFSCFNGNVEFIEVQLSKFDRRSYGVNYYTPQWKLLPFTMGSEVNVRSEISPPQNLDKMLTIAHSLAAEFPFARVDLYNQDGRIFFGELTFHPAGGFVPFNPPEWDAIFGKMLRLPNE